MSIAWAPLLTSFDRMIYRLLRNLLGCTPVGAAFSVLLLISWSSAAVQAQSFRIVDKQTGQGIELANVGVTGSTLGGVTDENGFITLEGVKITDTISITDTRYTRKTLSWREIQEAGFLVELRPGQTLTTLEITAVSRSSQRLSETPNEVTVISSDAIAFQQVGSAADILRESGEVFVQKSQGGGGSPVLRGFEANKVLIVVDGVRMNNAIFRSGHLQNVIALDEAIIDRAEVVFGPGSALYGSDALGGVMAFSTKRPLLAWNDSLNFKGMARTRYASATGEKSAHLQLNFGKERFAALTAITVKDFEDIRSGSRSNPFYPDFGKRDWYVETIHREDTIIDIAVSSEDRDLQRHTGYSQLNLMQKFRILPGSKGLEIEAGFHLSTSTDVPRYDRLTQSRQELDANGDSISNPRYAEWNYGPQNWIMGYATLRLPETRAWKNGRIVAAYQHFDDSRISRLYRSIDRIIRDEDVDALSLNLDFDRAFEGPSFTDQHRLFYGAELVWNGVNSAAWVENAVSSNNTADASTRYPDGGTSTWSGAIYGKYQYRANRNLILTTAVRFSQYALQSEFEDTTFFNFPFSEIEISTGALTGSAGLVWSDESGWKIDLLASSGFRAPNLDDVAKVFDSNPGTVIVPNDDLGPEFAYTVEAGLEKTIDDRVRLSATAYYTWLRDAIVRSAFSFDGQDSIIYDGELSQVLANTNSGSARIAGLSLGLDARLNKVLRARASLTWTEGVDREIDAPLGHIPPLFGMISLEAKKGPLRSELYVHYNSWKRLGDYSPSGVDNLEDATTEGTPAWYTLNFRAAWQANTTFRVNLAIENIIDQHYRTFASGVSAPGRNIVIGLQANF